jgi:dolichyl-phosphate-mannose-protein mannosyltransferase
LQGEEAPPDMQYTGFCFSSVVLMAFSVLFFYSIIHRITEHKLLAFAFSSFIIFDNALVVHARAAMLEGIQLFFVLGALYYFTLVVTSNKKILLKHYAIRQFADRTCDGSLSLFCAANIWIY